MENEKKYAQTEFTHAPAGNRIAHRNILCWHVLQCISSAGNTTVAVITLNILSIFKSNLVYKCIHGCSYNERYQ